MKKTVREKMIKLFGLIIIKYEIETISTYDIDERK